MMTIPTLNQVVWVATVAGRFQDGGTRPERRCVMTLPPLEICRRILALHELLGFPDGKDEKRAELLKLLAEHGLSWNDLSAFFAAVNASTGTPLPAPGSKSWESTAEGSVNYMRPWARQTKTAAALRRN
jgi:hypothetical protein